MKTETIRKKVKKAMIDYGYDRRGSLSVLAEAMGVNKNSLSMALTGYRNGKGSMEILEKLQSHLKNVQVNAFH